MAKLNREDFHPDFLEMIENLAKELDATPAAIIEYVIITKLAAEKAENDVYNIKQQLFPEFIESKSKLLRGKALYNIYYHQNKKSLEEALTIKLLEKEKFGFELKPHERELLIRKRLGQAWLESAEYQREQELEQVESVLKKEGKGEKLAPDEKALLIRHKKGQAWLNSDEYKAEQEAERVEMLLEKESFGIMLWPDEKALLVKHKKGKAWLNSREYREEQEKKKAQDQA